MKRIAFAITLVLALVGGAVAQTSTENTPTPFWEGYSLSLTNMDGVEVSAGTMDYVDSICWGKSFSLMGGNSAFTITPNYYWEQLPTGENSEYVSKITGGAWTMVYRLGKYNGLLFGEMSGGTIEWYTNKAGDVLYGNITAELSLKGGTGSFSKVGGPNAYGKFTGTVTYHPKEGHPTIVGTVDLMF